MTVASVVVGNNLNGQVVHHNVNSCISCDYDYSLDIDKDGNDEFKFTYQLAIGLGLNYPFSRWQQVYGYNSANLQQSLYIKYSKRNVCNSNQKSRCCND